MFMLLLFLVQFTVNGSNSDRIYRYLMYVIMMGVEYIFFIDVKGVHK